MIKNLLIVGLCIVIGILIAYLFRPAPKPEIVGNLTTDQENELLANLVTLEGQNDSLRRELDKSKASGKTAAVAFKQVIGGLKQEIAKGKSKPVVIQLVQENPSLDSLHQAYDSAMVAYEGRTVALTMEMQMRDNINAQIQANFEQRLAQTEQLLHDKEIENEQLSKENRKLRRKLTLTKITGVIILGGIIVLAL